MRVFVLLKTEIRAVQPGLTPHRFRINPNVGDERLFPVGETKENVFFSPLELSLKNEKKIPENNNYYCDNVADESDAATLRDTF